MTPEATLRAEIEADEAALAEKRAKLEAMESEPVDPVREAVRSAVIKALDIGDMIELCDFDLAFSEPGRRYAEDFVDRLIAALPLAPAAPVDDSEIDKAQLAFDVAQRINSDLNTRSLAGEAYDAAYLAIEETLAIRATLSRGVQWPSEAGLDWLRKHIDEVDHDNHYWNGPHKREYLSAPEILKHLTAQVQP